MTRIRHRSIKIPETVLLRGEENASREKEMGEESGSPNATVSIYVGGGDGPISHKWPDSPSFVTFCSV